MSKYNMYNNELTMYIDASIDFPISIKDIVGDIVGDVLNFNSPVDIPDGDLTFGAKTALGIMTIKVTKSSTKNVLVFSREIGGAIYEEYTLELDNPPISFLVYGRILEERENGVIVTNIIRHYDYCNYDDADKRLVGSEETRKVYKDKQIWELLPNIGIDKMNIEEKFYALKALNDLSRMKGIKPLVDTVINLDIPGYLGTNYRRGEFTDAQSININGNIISYRYIKGNKTLERINDLLHGNITSRTVDDLKHMIECCQSGFNYLHLYILDTLFDKEYPTQLQKFEDKHIGSSKVKLESEYYKYLKDLIVETFHIEIDLPATPNEIYKEIDKQLWG